MEIANRSLSRINVRDDIRKEEAEKDELINYIESSNIEIYMDPDYENKIKKNSPFDLYFDNLINELKNQIDNETNENNKGKGEISIIKINK